MGCCFTVPQASVGMVEQWGRFVQTAPPGCHCVNPCLQEVSGLVSLRVQQLDVQCETKTKDNVFVQVMCSVQYQVIPNEVFTAYYTLTNPRSQIEHYVFDVVRATVPKISLDELFETKDEIARTVKQELDKVMTSYGFEILQALVTDVDPAPKVKDAMNAIMEAKRMKDATIHKAEAQKIAIVRAAEADAESKALAGAGIGRQRLAIVDGLRDSVVSFAEEIDGATAKDVMDMVLVTQYFDTLKDLGNNPNVRTVFVPHDSKGGNNELRKGMLEAQAAMLK
eukprot:CAMPEP_0201489186 /NCGR_PEP_ID=MMETSP0151_2-20130828/21105_1 /ASSEMBLY_ACC=CAM_ASM_000257 /TAXON_ID=200890 /ORGANISM="Paramoeba atlantica, Strain 621/1 / CCAP 1560/9" /LENGTH=280 /DNA_ID=CAMNT_0047874685 /DNA_START=88 /DNA_END=930 /DNA_ORIENTATION=+